ncbi:hypothetical protein D3C81_324150 [compost metagenome]
MVRPLNRTILPSKFPSAWDYARWLRLAGYFCSYMFSFKKWVNVLIIMVDMTI